MQPEWTSSLLESQPRRLSRDSLKLVVEVLFWNSSFACSFFQCMSSSIVLRKAWCRYAFSCDFTHYSLQVFIVSTNLNISYSLIKIFKPWPFSSAQLPGLGPSHKRHVGDEPVVIYRLLQDSLCRDCLWLVDVPVTALTVLPPNPLHWIIDCESY